MIVWLSSDFFFSLVLVGIAVCEVAYMVLYMVWDILYGVIGVVCVCVGKMVWWGKMVW